MKAFYYLVQIAHMFLQLLELGSLLKHLAQAYQATPIQLFGSLKNPARAGLNACWIASAISTSQLTLSTPSESRFRRDQIRLDTS